MFLSETEALTIQHSLAPLAYCEEWFWSIWFAVRPGRHLQIILHLQIKNVIPLTVGWNSSHIKCVVEPSWFSNATTVTIWNVNPQSGPGCHMLNSLHCLLLFWEAQESRQSTSQGEQKTLDKSYQYKFNGWKSCLLKERKR